LSKTSVRIRKSACDPNHLELTNAVFRGKWSLAILCALRDGPIRLGQLTRMIPGASKKMLLENLKRLEATGIIVRKDLSQRVLHVEYDFDEHMRETICRLLECFIAWAELCVKNEKASLDD
jgi:DNA-binding HxlR family transcriptional regulator